MFSSGESRSTNKARTRSTRTRTKRVAADTDVSKRSPARRAARDTAKTTARKSAPAKSASKKTAAKKPAAAPLAEAAAGSSAPGSERRAPTNLPQKTTRKKQRIHLMVVGCVLLVGIGASAAVGFTDSGYIDINEQILSQYTPEERANRTVPVQNTNTERKIDGGLRGLGTGGSNPPRPITEPPATTTATTSEATASSTADAVGAPETATTTAPVENDEDAQVDQTTATASPATTD